MLCNLWLTATYAKLCKQPLRELKMVGKAVTRDPLPSSEGLASETYARTVELHLNYKMKLYQLTL